MIRHRHIARVSYFLGAAVLLATAGCGPDEANREYFAALRGAEQGLTRMQQRAHLDRAIELAPNRVEYYSSRALNSISGCDLAAAISDLDYAIALADRPYLRYLRGMVRCQARDYQAALPDFDTAIAGQPENAQFYRGRSLARSEVNDLVGAMQDAERLVALVPQRGTSYFARGRVLAARGEFEAAIGDFTLAHNMRPELAYPVAARAACYELLGNDDRAAEDRVLAEGIAGGYSDCSVFRDPFRW